MSRNAHNLTQCGSSQVSFSLPIPKANHFSFLGATKRAETHVGNKMKITTTKKQQKALEKYSSLEIFLKNSRKKKYFPRNTKNVTPVFFFDHSSFFQFSPFFSFLTQTHVAYNYTPPKTLFPFFVDLFVFVTLCVCDWHLNTHARAGAFFALC